MARYSPSVQNLISKLGSLPGIGGKSAQKLAFSILAMSQEEADALTGAIVEARRLTKRCSICQNFTDSDPCPICSDPKRDTSTVCVVESPSEVSVFERMHEYNGLYHVLHGVFNPVGNMNMNDAAKATPISDALICDKNTDSGCLLSFSKRMSGCSTMFQ